MKNQLNEIPRYSVASSMLMLTLDSLALALVLQAQVHESRVRRFNFRAIEVFEHSKLLSVPFPSNIWIMRWPMFVQHDLWGEASGQGKLKTDHQVSWSSSLYLLDNEYLRFSTTALLDLISSKNAYFDLVLNFGSNILLSHALNSNTSLFCLVKSH